MNDDVFQVGAPGLDAEKLVAEIRRSVEEKMRTGAYTDARVARAERMNLAHFRDDEAFTAFYLDCLREAVFVDIGDFEIHERRPRFSGALILLKRCIWKLLKFYTYRLWSQQNQVNGLLLSALESVERRQREGLRRLEERMARLESRDPAPADR